MGSASVPELRSSAPPRRAAISSRPRLCLDDNETRRRIEEVAQSALDTARRLIALLHHLEVDPDREDGADAKPSLSAPEHRDSQVIRLRSSSSEAGLDAAR